jgi:hypothetical protein
MTTKLIHILLLFALLMVGCKNNNVTIVPVTQVEYQIYATIIDSLYNDSLQYSFVISDSTAPNDYKMDLKGFKNGKWFAVDELNQLKDNDSTLSDLEFSELSNNYQSMNGQRFNVRTSLIRSSRLLKQVSSDSLKIIFATDKSRDWSLFHKVFPNSGGLIKFSRIGFNRSNTWAAMYYSCVNGGLDGVGMYVLLQKNGTSWQIKATALDWES